MHEILENIFYFEFLNMWPKVTS